MTAWFAAPAPGPKRQVSGQSPAPHQVAGPHPVFDRLDVEEPHLEAATNYVPMLLTGPVGSYAPVHAL